jgi:transcriptional regulator with XRE-family HTH domain
MSSTEQAGGLVPEWSLGERLRKARDWRGVSIEDMAADIGRSERTIRNYETDSTRAPLLVVKQYAMRTQVPYEWLETGHAPTTDDNGPEGGARTTAPATSG